VPHAGTGPGRAAGRSTIGRCRAAATSASATLSHHIPLEERPGGQHLRRPEAVGEPARERLAEAPEEVLDRDGQRETSRSHPRAAEIGSVKSPKLAHAEGEQRDQGRR